MRFNHPAIPAQEFGKALQHHAGVNILRSGAAGSAQNLLGVEDRHARMGFRHRNFGQIHMPPVRVKLGFFTAQA